MLLHGQKEGMSQIAMFLYFLHGRRGDMSKSVVFLNVLHGRREVMSKSVVFLCRFAWSNEENVEKCRVFKCFLGKVDRKCRKVLCFCEFSG